MNLIAYAFIAGAIVGGAIVGGAALWMLCSSSLPYDATRVSEDWLKQNGYDRGGY